MKDDNSSINNLTISKNFPKNQIENFCSHTRSSNAHTLCNRGALILQRTIKCSKNEKCDGGARGDAECKKQGNKVTRTASRARAEGYKSKQLTLKSPEKQKKSGLADRRAATTISPIFSHFSFRFHFVRVRVV